MSIEADVEIYFYGMLKICSGKLLADLTDIHSNFGIEFGTQDDEQYVAPAVTLNVIDLSLDSAKSDIKVEGFILSFFTDMILKEFKNKIFKKIAEETTKIIEGPLETDTNNFLKAHGSHYKVDGLGFDFSQTRQPTVTDDSLLSFFMKGVFYGDNATEEAYAIEHTKFEVGQEGVQDMMIHVSETVMQSLLKFFVASDSYLLSKYIYDSFLSH